MRTATSAYAACHRIMNGLLRLTAGIPVLVLIATSVIQFPRPTRAVLVHVLDSAPCEPHVHATDTCENAARTLSVRLEAGEVVMGTEMERPEIVPLSSRALVAAFAPYRSYILSVKVGSEPGVPYQDLITVLEAAGTSGLLDRVPGVWQLELVDAEQLDVPHLM